MSTTKHYATIEKPWMKYYDMVSDEDHLPQCTLYELVKERSRSFHFENETALFYYGTEITFSKMFEIINQYAAAFSCIGVKQGEAVSLISPTLPESVCILYALNKIGAVANIIDPRTDESHTLEFIKKAKSRVLVTLEMCYKHVNAHLDELGLDYVICIDPSASLPTIKRFGYRLKCAKYDIPYDGKRILRVADFFESASGKSVESVKYEPGMPAVITRTGGTTGISKGVVLTNDSMNAVAANFYLTIPNPIVKDKYIQSFLNFVPLAASYGIVVSTHMSMTMGLKNIMIPNFNPDKFDKMVLAFKPRHIIGVPVIYEKLIYSPKMKGKDLSFISTMAAGGDSASESLEDKLDEFRISHNIKYPIAQGYGLSEVSSACSFGFRDVHKKGSVGLPCYFNTIAAFEPDTENELPIGEIGEICISGPTVMKEYLDEPEETASVLRTHCDGRKWVHSGDLGYIDDDGFLFIVGRIKRAIIRGDGHKVFPLQLEKIVLRHPAVENCAVIGVRDRNYSSCCHLPLICAELNDSNADKDTIRNELMQLCADNIEKRSMPAGVVFVDKIPLTGLMKNDYKALEAEYENYNYK